MADLDLIRKHHAIAEAGNWLGTGNARHIHEQRGQLLDEVARLTAENEQLRRAFAAVIERTAWRVGDTIDRTLNEFDLGQLVCEVPGNTEGSDG